MDSILKKMNWKEGMNIQVWNAPTELTDRINSWSKAGLIDTGQKPDFMLAFVQTEDEIETYFSSMLSLVTGDELCWMAYPKGTSKRYKPKINRDSGWGYLRKFDFEGVRQIAIDEDWSALRFRNIKFIKNMRRQFSSKNQ